jgi:hypothetical protein
VVGTLPVFTPHLPHVTPHRPHATPHLPHVTLLTIHKVMRSKDEVCEEWHEGGAKHHDIEKKRGIV